MINAVQGTDRVVEGDDLLVADELAFRRVSGFVLR
jgi:hypothetical protein